MVSLKFFLEENTWFFRKLFDDDWFDKNISKSIKFGQQIHKVNVCLICVS